MRYFDAHLGLPSPDREGLDALVRHVESDKDFVAGNLILNTPEEVELVSRHPGRLPPTLNKIPYYTPAFDAPEELSRSGWYKIHPRLHGFEAKDIEGIKEALLAAPVRPKGMVVCCFPWGPNLRYNISLPLVIEIARTLPDMPVLATHGGGYESWQLRAHAGPLKNVYFDFSATMSYYFRSDLLRPFQRYLRHTPKQLLFGSDWPTGDTQEHLNECLRLAEEVSVSREELETLLLDNAARLWPEAFTAAERGRGTKN
jgi:hypothetical protein